MLRIFAAAGAIALFALAAPRLPGAQGAVTGFVANGPGGETVVVGRGGRVWRVADRAALAPWAGRAVSLAGKLRGRRFVSVDSVVEVGMARRAERAFLRRPQRRSGFRWPLRAAMLPLRLLVRTGTVAARACRAAGRLTRGSRRARQVNNYRAR